VQQGTQHRVLSAAGPGYVVGCYLNAIGTDGSWNILEGDERMFVDGAMAAQFHGTGLEDYFSGGWYYAGLFERPLHGLVTKAPIRTTQYRFHLADRIPFAKQIFFAFEFGDRNAARGGMSSVAYWYAAAPTPAGSTTATTPAPRQPPPDPLEPTAIISRLAEFERRDLYDEAKAAAEEYAEKFAGTPYAPALELRALYYRELLEGFSTVRPAYEAFQKRADVAPEVLAQAADLLWFHESPENALLGVNSIGRFSAYLDGQPVIQGDSPTRLFVGRTTVKPGAHELTLDADPSRPDPFVLVYLRTHGTNVTSDGDWEWVDTRPANWPGDTTAVAGWTRVVHANHGLPKMMYWQFEPNAYGDMQGGYCGIRPWENWEGDKKTAYFRRRFELTPAP